MNVIISNKNQALLENLGIDVIKEMNGEFEVDEIIATFQNFFYQRMILDITAIKNYLDIRNLQKLSISLNMEKVILLLDGTDATSNPTFLSNLVSMGIYNFAKNVEGIQYLYNTPNTYRDVAQFHNLTQQVPQSNQQQSVMSSINNKNNPIANSILVEENGATRVIGVKNLTKQSGATSLVYMIRNVLKSRYKVIAIEADKTDFTYFNDNTLLSVPTSDIGTVIKRNSDMDVIVIDINNSVVAEGFCQDVLYLIEPSIIKLQKLMALNAVALQGLKNKKVVLNQSLLSNRDVANFEYEARVNVFYNLPPLNERVKEQPDLAALLVKLGFNKLR